VNCWTQGIRFLLSALMGVMSLPAKDAQPNFMLKFPIADVTGRVFVRVEAHPHIRDHERYSLTAPWGGSFAPGGSPQAHELAGWRAQSRVFTKPAPA